MGPEKVTLNAKECHHREITSQAWEEYYQLYKDEIELNKVFNQFVLNYKAAYEGRNTRKEQVIGTISKKHLADKGMMYANNNKRASQVHQKAVISEHNNTDQLWYKALRLYTDSSYPKQSKEVLVLGWLIVWLI